MGCYYPSGAIRTYMNIKNLVESRFSDKSRKPYVTVSKYFNEVTIKIYKENEKITHKIQIDDVKKLKWIYNELDQLIFRRIKEAFKDRESNA